MSVQRQKRNNPWPVERLDKLETAAANMNIAQLAELFDERKDYIRQTCLSNNIKFLKAGPQMQLNAQESIDLFKNRYKNETLNLLITNSWSNT